MTTYNLIQPPFSLRFDEMSKTELVSYNTWFHRILPERTLELTNAIRSTDQYTHWTATFTPDSLRVSGEWFEGQVGTRPRTSEEASSIKPIFRTDPSTDTELDNRTFSLAVDIGMYFGQVVLLNIPGTSWAQPLNNKKFADYGQPVIMGFGTIPLNPIRVIIMTAYAISRGKRANLNGLFDTWAKLKK